MKELLSKLLDKPWASPDSEREMSQVASSYRGLAAWPYREQWLLNTAVAYKDVASQKAVSYQVQHNYVMSWKKYLRNVKGTLSVEELEFAWSAFRDALVTKAKPRRAMHLPPLMVAIGDRRTYLESIVNETAFLKTAKVVFKLEVRESSRLRLLLHGPILSIRKYVCARAMIYRAPLLPPLPYGMAERGVESPTNGVDGKLGVWVLRIAITRMKVNCVSCEPG